MKRTLIVTFLVCLAGTALACPTLSVDSITPTQWNYTHPTSFSGECEFTRVLTRKVSVTAIAGTNYAEYDVYFQLNPDAGYFAGDDGPNFVDGTTGIELEYFQKLDSNGDPSDGSPTQYACATFLWNCGTGRSNAASGSDIEAEELLQNDCATITFHNPSGIV